MFVIYCDGPTTMTMITGLQRWWWWCRLLYWYLKNKEERCSLWWWRQCANLTWCWVVWFQYKKKVLFTKYPLYWKVLSLTKNGLKKRNNDFWSFGHILGQVKNFSPSSPSFYNEIFILNLFFQFDVILLVMVKSNVISPPQRIIW